MSKIIRHKEIVVSIVYQALDDARVGSYYVIMLT